MHRLEESRKVVGTKQTMKVLQNKTASAVYVASDADERITRQVIDLAEDQEIPVITVDTMVQLGKKCNIDVKTAIAAIIN